MAPETQRAWWQKASQKYRQTHREEVNTSTRIRYQKNPVKAMAATKQWRKKNPSYDSEWRNKNRSHVNEYHREWKQNNLEKVKISNRNSHLKRTYGITLEQYNQIFQQQDCKCAACGSPDPGRKTGWALDHNHSTGKIRGILCNTQ